MKTITIGFSPCPNDTYIFDAIVNKRIETGGYHFNPIMEDVEALNRLAAKGELDITKISVGAFADVSKHYVILDSGSALGRGVGPLVVVKNTDTDFSDPELRIAIPGKKTTANLLFSIFFPHLTNKTEFLFSDIENRVISGEADAGLLIHEGRFTYQKKNLTKRFDLGELWEDKMHMPLPLGCIGASRKLPAGDRHAISLLIRNSIEYAQLNPLAGKAYIKSYAQEMDDEIIEQHIALYVNEFSITLGLHGRNAISFLLNQGVGAGLLNPAIEPIFND